MTDLSGVAINWNLYFQVRTVPALYSCCMNSIEFFIQIYQEIKNDSRVEKKNGDEGKWKRK